MPADDAPNTRYHGSTAAGRGDVALVHVDIAVTGPAEELPASAPLDQAAPLTDSSTAQQFAGRLRAARRAAGLTQQTVSWRTGLQRSAVADIERAARRVEVFELKRLAELYGTTAAALLDMPDAPLDESLTPLFTTFATLAADRQADVLLYAEFLRWRRARLSAVASHAV